MAANEDFFKVFGHISVFFATWDFFATCIVTRLVNAEINLQDLGGWTLGQKLRYLESLSPEKVVNANLLLRIQSALPPAIEVSKDRNRFIHDQWEFNPEKVLQGLIDRLTPNLRHGPTGRTFSFSAETYSLEQLYSFLDRVGEQQRVFARFLDDLPVG